METVNFGEENNNNDSAPKAPNNRKKKLIWAGIILAALILSVIGWQYWRYIHSTYYQQMQGVKYLERMAKESDKWGGKTPEETVALFRGAVEKGDFDLASKYGKQSIKSDLEKIKAEGNIGALLKDLEIGKMENKIGFGADYRDFVIKENGEIKYIILTIRKSDGGAWKIVEF